MHTGPVLADGTCLGAAEPDSGHRGGIRGDAIEAATETATPN